MLWFGLLFVLLCFGRQGESAYFTMTDVTLNIPGNRSMLLPNNTAIATMYALNDYPIPRKMDHIRYSLMKTSEEHYLEIYPITGDIMFTTALLNETSKNISWIKVEVYAVDSRGTDSTTFQVNILPSDIVDCDLITGDLCYWQSATYSVYENRKSSTIGTLGSSYLAEMCQGYRINYTLIKGSSHFSLVPPTDQNKTWGLKTIKALDRDISRDSATVFGVGQTVNVTVECEVINPNRTVRNITKTLTVNVLDEDDNAPCTHDNSTLHITIDKSSAIDNTSLANFPSHRLIFYDKDSPGVNKYHISLTGDGTKYIKEVCEVHVDDRNDENQTIIVCRLVFTKNFKLTNSTYRLVLEINDTTHLPELGNSIVRQPIEISVIKRPKTQILAQTKLVKDTLPPLILYPSRKVRIFRTAAPFARVTQPDIRNIWNATNFHIKNSTNDQSKILAITPSEGIVYVEDIIGLRIKSTIPLVIGWTRNGTKEADHITVTVINEQTNTCLNVSGNINEWEHCAKFDNFMDCEQIKCSLSTGGAPNVEMRIQRINRCVWRGEKKPKNSSTSPLYSTCTPDVVTCPDKRCDSLEQLDELICPQDCSVSMDFPTPKNLETGRGIGDANGICTCGTNGKCFCDSTPRKGGGTGKKTKSISTTTVPSMNNFTKLVSQHVGKQTGNDIGACGTPCMLGIAAGVVFLLGAVAIVVACWRLDRVQKAVRGKFTDDGQDLSAPLSDYVDRGLLPDTLQLNFDMITMLNQENKMRVDPKWEFPRTNLVIEQTLGEGEFGRVLRARAKDIAGQTGYTTVAVKTLKEDARGGELADLLSEYELLKEVSHPNVIRLLGACTVPGGPVYLIIEFAQYGSLRSYLRRSRHLKSESDPPMTTRLEANNEQDYDIPSTDKEKITPNDILSFAWQISNGMTYLTEIKLVHRDLAARNILLASGKICKISDFGLTRDVYEDNAYYKRSKGRVPVKWMAPESLSDHVYTAKSDVWSFGILVWELVTLGATPYPGVPVQNLFHLLRQGYRMERPENCSIALYKTMQSCWHIDPNERPSFNFLSTKFDKMLSDGMEYLDLTTNVIHNRSYFCTNFEDNEDDFEMTNNNRTPASSVNYFDKQQQYVKCGESEKVLENVVAHNLQNCNITSTQGYESPVKHPRPVKRPTTPTNECPQYYTNMAKHD